VGIIAAYATDDESPWNQYVTVGLFVAILGVILFFLSGGVNHPSGGFAYGSFLLSLGVMVLGSATIIGGVAWRFWQTSHGMDPDF
jgi:uncharacterized membrane protein YccC